MLQNRKTNYDSMELFEIFKEQHRLCSPLDPMANEKFVLRRETKIIEWRDAQDLLEWEELSEFLNQEFRINISLDIWKTVLTPDNKKTLGDVCDFLSTVAEKDIINPIKIFGVECLSAAIFLTLKRNLKNKGVDVSDLKPSTSIELFLNKNFSALLEVVTLTGYKTFDKIEYGKLNSERQFKYWIDRIFPNLIYNRTLETGEIQTFRDLVNRILLAEELKN
jgi:hypothetical protein